MSSQNRDAALVRRAARRLALQFGLVIALILAVVGVVVSATFDASIRSSYEEQLESAIEAGLPREYSPLAPVAVVVHGDIRVADDLPDGLPDLEALERVLQGERRVTTTVVHEDHEYLVLTEREDDEVVQAAADVHEAAEERGRVSSALALGGVVGVAIAALGAYVLARRAMRPLAAVLGKQRRFVADASHELRTPLTLLSTRVQMLRRKLGTTAVPDLVAREIGAIERDTQSMTRLLEELLAAADERPVAPESVDVVALAHDAVAAAQAHATHSSVLLEITGESFARVLATPEGVRQILTALLANAIDHARGRVTVRIDSDLRYVKILVIDDGNGFSPDADVFERFASHRTQTGGGSHYGLGLALVAEIVHRLRGTVHTRPDLNGGVIEVMLPSG